MLHVYASKNCSLTVSLMAMEDSIFAINWVNASGLLMVGGVVVVLGLGVVVLGEVVVAVVGAEGVVPVDAAVVEAVAGVEVGVLPPPALKKS